MRAGDIWMPVDLQVGETVQRLDSREPRHTVTITTDERPSRVVLDPENMLLDVEPANNAAEVVGSNELSAAGLGFTGRDGGARSADIAVGAH
jgi:hypothetical protein